MKFSAKVEYAIRALIELSAQEGKGPLGTREIAARQGIPERFLEQQVSALVKAGFIRSQRGAQGGCVLAKHPENISVLEVIEALEGPILEMDCLGESDFSRGCEQKSLCVLQEVWSESQSCLREYLGGVSIADLLRRQQEKAQSVGVIYHI